MALDGREGETWPGGVADDGGCEATGLEEGLSQEPGPLMAGAGWDREGQGGEEQGRNRAVQGAGLSGHPAVTATPRPGLAYPEHGQLGVFFPAQQPL